MRYYHAFSKMPKIIKENPKHCENMEQQEPYVPYLWNIKSFDHFEKLEISYKSKHGFPL